jgi:DNA-binding MarR family transcriptional regulator
MSMEDEMSQASLPPEANRIFREFLTAVVLHGQAVADAMGMHPTDAYALNLLAVIGPVTVGELGRYTGLTTGAATRLVDRLESSGVVRRTRDSQDRRRVVIETLPPQARVSERAELVLGPAREAFADVLGCYDGEQLATLFDFFTRTTTALRGAMTAAHNSGPR